MTMWLVRRQLQIVGAQDVFIEELSLGSHGIFHGIYKFI